MDLLQLSSGELATVAVKAMYSKSPLLPLVQFYPMVGNADYVRKVASATGGQYRSLNDPYPDNKVDPAFANPTLTIFGDKVQVDQAHERRGRDIASVRAAELIRFSMNLGKNFNYQFINGDPGVDAKQITGVKTMITDQIVPGVPTNGLTVLLGNSDAAKTSQQQFLELIDDLIAMLNGADALVMDFKTISRMGSIARDLCETRVNEFGVPIKYYNNVALLDAGKDAAGTKTITHTETYGANTATTSIYGAKFGEETDLTVATNVGVEAKDLDLVGSHYVHQVEMDIATALLDNDAIGVLPGIEIATSA